MRIVKSESFRDGLANAAANGSLAQIERALSLIDLDALDKKISRERGIVGAELWSPIAINKAFISLMPGWRPYTQNYWVCEDFIVNAAAAALPFIEQHAFILAAGFEPYRSNTQSDFLRGTTVIEMQLGKYPFVFYDIFVKNSILRKIGLIDTAIEIVPMKSLQASMSSGPSYFEFVSHRISMMHEDSMPCLPTVLLGVA